MRRSGSDPKDTNAYVNRALSYRNKGEFDRAIADYSEAIRLDPKNTDAYENRALSYRNKGELDRAIADYNELMRLDPKNAAAYANRGDAYRDKGEIDRAIADYSEAIKRDPKAQYYRIRAIANLYAGGLPRALADFNQASELDPKDPYTALWLDIAGRRSNVPSRLADATKQIDMTKWPAAIVRLYLGHLTPEAVLAAADDPNPKTKNDQVCEANFYTGELALQRNDKDEVARLFRLAAAECPKTFIEWYPANAELKALGAVP